MENEQMQTAEQTAQTAEQTTSQKKEQAIATLKQILELKEPVFLPRLAEKLSKHLSLIYLVGLIVLTLTMFSSLVSLFFTPIIGFCNMVMTAVWFVVFRMLCETLLTYQKTTETSTDIPEMPTSDQ